MTSQSDNSSSNKQKYVINRLGLPDDFLSPALRDLVLWRECIIEDRENNTDDFEINLGLLKT